MAVEIATGYIALAPIKASGFDGDLRQKFKDVKVDVPVGFDKGAAVKAGKDIGDSVSSGVKSSVDAKSKGGGLGLGALIGGGIGGAAVITFGKAVFEASSNLNEATSKVGVVFGENAGQIVTFADGAAKALGLSKTQALEAAGTFGNLFRAMGIGTDTAADMSTKLLTLSGDLASFNNANPDDVLVALKAGLVGETEPLRQFGVNLNEARIQAEALRLGLVKGNVNATDVQAANIAVAKAQANLTALQKSGKATSLELTDAQNQVAQANENLTAKLAGNVPQLDASQKAQAAYSLILADTSLAQGDFARTADGAANKSRIASAEFENLKATLGDKVAPVGNAVLSGAIAGLDGLKAWWDANGEGVKKWFTDIFGTDPGANFAAGLDVLKQKFTDIFGPDPVANFKAGADEISTKVHDVFGEDPGANFSAGLQTIKDKLGGVVDWWTTNVGTWDDFKQGLTWLGDGLKVIKEKGIDPFVGVVQTLIDKLTGLADNEVVKFLLGKDKNATSGETLGAGADLIRKLIGFDSGGIIPGPTGSSRLVIAHGGETVLPTHRMGLGDALTSVTGYSAPGPMGGRNAGVIVENLVVGPGDSRQRAGDVVHELRGLGLRSRGGS